MKLTLDLEKKWVTVIKAPDFEAVCDFMKQHFPESWTSWILNAEGLKTREFANKENENNNRHNSENGNGAW